jgi:ferric-dicitrate binding protein FerR (iron transport regulator)
MGKIALGVAFLLGAGVLFSQEAVIREAVGTVEVKAAGAADWSPAEPGQIIGRTAVLSTGFKSTAVLGLGNSTLTVQPLTRLTVEELAESGGNERVNLNLRTGRIRADVKPPAGGKTEFVVKSPTATASVRGTVFEFNGIQLQVDEGRVHISAGDRIGSYVGAGHEVQTDPDTGRTGTVAEAAKENLAPSLPAGMNSAPETKPAPLRNAKIDLGVDWR